MTINVHVSSNTESAADVVSNSQPGKKRKGRGKTTGLSVQKKRKDSDNGKLKVIIPPDRTVAVGPGAKDFVAELSVKVLQHARHDVKKWKEVPNLAKDRIVAHMLDTFLLPDTQHNRDTILQTANNLYRYRRSRLHDHFKKFASNEESLQNMPAEVNEAEWNFLVDYFSSDAFKDKLTEIVAEQTQEVEEDTDVDPIINAAFVKLVGEKSGYCRGQGSGVMPASRRSMHVTQEQLQAQQKEVEEERHKRENVECKLIEVENQLAEERKKREIMEARLVGDQKILKQGMMALVSHIQSSEMRQVLQVLWMIAWMSSIPDIWFM
ncbi:uncharacterized protein LOC107783858 isoform X1 [Nicotiana tabacum]|uniref:Uncharacterized protein LOC107783858 isoform X1 n=1 Tax=Nicotiana tabacum TaxID=4097 RepID=A0AC58RSK4_TOBAC